MHRLFYMMKRSRKLISANKGETIMSNTVITIARQYGSGGRTVWIFPATTGRLFRSLPKKAAFIPLCFRMRKKDTALYVLSLPAASKMPPRFPRKAQVLQRMTTFFAIRQKSSASSQRKAPALSSDAAPTISLQMFQALSVSLSTHPKIFVCRKQ
jgi:hypothetical protein